MLDFNWNWRKENCDFAPASVRPTTTATNWHKWNEFDRESWVISAGLTWRHQSTLFYYAIAVADWSSIWRDPLMWYAANDKIAPNFIIDDNILRDCTWHRNEVIFQRSNRLNSPGGSPSFLSRIFLFEIFSPSPVHQSQNISGRFQKRISGSHRTSRPTSQLYKSVHLPLFWTNSLHVSHIPLPIWCKTITMISMITPLLCCADKIEFLLHFIYSMRLISIHHIGQLTAAISLTN